MPRVLARRPARAALPLACALLGWCVPASAETLRYTIAVPDGQAVTYRVDLEVRHPGELVVRAEWTGPRTLSLRLTPPDAPWGTVHRAGSSPQSLAAPVETVGTWALRVHSLAADGGGTGTLTIELPEPEARPPRPSGPEEGAPEAPAHPVEPWMAARPIPPGASESSARFLRATEHLREAVAGDPTGVPADVCQWQIPLVRYLDRQRERLLDGGGRPAESTAKLLGRIALAVGSVEELRTSDDPLIAGPPPRDPRLFDAWRKLRTTRLDPVESELDRILTMVRRDFASELEPEEWPARFVSCLTACERFFEQRVRVGETRARNRDLARAQWPTIVLAAEALRALSDLTPVDRAATGSPLR